ncbi:MAG: hypothetical protein ACK4ND_14545 [Cytophagaceae bacterium]
MDNFENRYMRYWFEGDVLCGEFTSEVEIDLKIAKAVVEGRLKYSNYKNVKGCIDCCNVKKMSRDARVFFSEPSSCKSLKVAALVINSAVQKMIGNFIIKIHKPPVPTKLFTCKEEAMQWLGEF